MNDSNKQYLEKFAEETRLLLIGPLAQGNIEIIQPVIFVDGGSNHRENNIGLAVGDGDSYAGKLDHKLNPEKDLSDLAYALSLIPSHFTELQLTGFLGGRRDHELFNLGEAFHFLKSRKQPTEVTFDNTITAYSAGLWRFNQQGLFSLATFEPTQVTLAGDCKYAIPKNTTVSPVTSYGLSNEGYGDISLANNAPVFIFYIE